MLLVFSTRLCVLAQWHPQHQQKQRPPVTNELQQLRLDSIRQHSHRDLRQIGVLRSLPRLRHRRGSAVGSLLTRRVAFNGPYSAFHPQILSIRIYPCSFCPSVVHFHAMFTPYQWFNATPASLRDRSPGKAPSHGVLRDVDLQCSGGLTCCILTRQQPAAALMSLSCRNVVVRRTNFKLRPR